MKPQQYIIRKSPKDNLWYVLGFCGDNYYIPISQGYKSKPTAKQYAKLQPSIDYYSKIAGANTI